MAYPDHREGRGNYRRRNGLRVFADGWPHPSMTQGRATRTACLAWPRLPVPPVERMFANGGTASTGLFRPYRGFVVVG